MKPASDREAASQECGPAEGVSDTANRVMSSRRGLIRAGIRASPIILTLASRPVLAWQCMAPSAHASANLSHNTHGTWPDACTATSAAWLELCGRDNGRGSDRGNKGKDACGKTLTFPSGVKKSTTCFSLMGSGTTQSIEDRLGKGSGFEKTLIAAMLNVRTGRVPSQCVTAADIEDMWAASGIGYQPSPGISWSKQDMVDYLHNNWIATVSKFGGTPPSA